MIKYNNNTINDWNFDTSNVIKVYRNNAIVFYKISGESPTPEYKVCFAVVDDISQYTDREFEDVYDNATEKWYKLNNLNQYEEYGIYGEGRNVTYYEGKLTIDEGDDGEDYSTHYLTFVAETDGVSYKYDTYTSSNRLQYSTDSGTTWSSLGNNQSTPSVNNGDKVLFKASGLTVNTERGIGRITPSASARVEGNIMSVAYGDDFISQTVVPNNYQFRKLFSGVTTITSAENMVLPATTIKKQSYSQMFQGCTSLTTAPTVIGSSSMTWSGDYCLSDMFNTCTSLVYPPQLPALNLGAQCYWYMFQGCTSLTTAPDLLATTTASECYRGMFSDCTSLNYITVMSSNSFNMYEWVKDVASSGTFIKNPNATWSSCGQNAYPCGWTVQDYVEPTPIKYEYEWNGSEWINVGEVTGSSKTSDFKIGDIDTPITSDASLITDGMYGVILPVSLSSNTSSAVALMGSSDTNTLSNLSSHTKTSVISENDIIDYAVWKFHGTATANTFYVENVATKKYFGYSNVSISYMPLVDESSKVPTVFSAFTYNNVTALGICKGNTPNQYYAINDLYGNHNQYNWFNPLSSAGDLNNSYVIYKLKGSDAEYPKYYSEKLEPLDNLTFNTLSEAQTYAYNNCVYDGMKAIIDGDRYYFDSSDENGWVKITEHYDELEYIQCGSGTTSTNGGLQLLTNATADYYFEVEAQCVMRSTSPMLIGEKSSVEVVSYQLGLCYYSSMFLDYGGGRLSTNINSTTQNQRHTYGVGHISGSSNPNVIGVKLDGVVQSTTNATTRVEGLPYLVGCGVGYTGHSASDVSVGTSNTDVVKLYSVKIYKDYGDTLVGDYIPVINSNDVVTLYDKVSGNYATPYGTLIAGPIV